MAYYSTVAKIRTESGFDGNLNIKNETILKFQARANARINSVIGSKYVLPLTANPILEMLETVLAAGYLMVDEYGVEAEGTEQDGKSKIEYVLGDGTDKKKGELANITSGLVRLFDEAGVEFPLSGSSTMRGYPTSSREPSFTRDMIF